MGDDLTGRSVTYHTFLLYDQDVWRYLQVGEKTRYRADKQVLGKKKISWSELAVGQRIQVRAKVLYEKSTWRDENPDMTITVQEVKVLKPKKA